MAEKMVQHDVQIRKARNTLQEMKDHDLSCTSLSVSIFKNDRLVENLIRPALALCAENLMCRYPQKAF
jgi:hypothetical protein